MSLVHEGSVPMNRSTRFAKAASCRRLAALALAAACAAPVAQANQVIGSDWLWLSSSFDAATCKFTTTVTWNGFRQANTLEAFATLGYAGSKLVSTFVSVQNKMNTATVTLPPLALSSTQNSFYTWAQ